MHGAGLVKLPVANSTGPTASLPLWQVSYPLAEPGRVAPKRTGATRPGSVRSRKSRLPVPIAERSIHF
jgi:hypothetical protein